MEIKYATVLTMAIAGLLSGVSSVAAAQNPDEKPLLEIPASDLQSHATEDDCWTAVDGRVYDITDYIAANRGLARVLARRCGQDSTGSWGPQVTRDDSVDSVSALLNPYLLGRLAGS